MFFFICAWINDWVNNHEAGDLRRHRTHYDVIVMRQANDNCLIHIILKYIPFRFTLKLLDHLVRNVILFSNIIHHKCTPVLTKIINTIFLHLDQAAEQTVNFPVIGESHIPRLCNAHAVRQTVMAQSIFPKYSLNHTTLVVLYEIKGIFYECKLSSYCTYLIAYVLALEWRHMKVIGSQITGHSTIYLTAYTGQNHRKRKFTANITGPWWG